MDPVRHRLSEFSQNVGDEKQTIRSIVARNEAPFDVETADGKQLTYGSKEYLAWCLYTQLRNMGIGARFASEGIRVNSIVEQIFDAYDRGDDLADLFLIADRHEKRRADETVRQMWGISLQPFAGVAEILVRGADAYGRPNLQGETRLGLSGATVVPILPCLQRCEAALEAKGFIMQGRHLFEKE